MGWLVAIPASVVLLAIAAVGFYEARKAYWDSEVTKLCEKDGGLKIFEIAQLNGSQLALLRNKFGQLDIPNAARAIEGVPLVHSDSKSIIRAANPEVWRYELAVVRRADGKVLGRNVTYARTGGDLFSPQPSTFLCPDPAKDLFSAVIMRGDTK